MDRKHFHLRDPIHFAGAYPPAQPFLILLGAPGTGTHPIASLIENIRAGFETDELFYLFREKKVGNLLLEGFIECPFSRID